MADIQDPIGFELFKNSLFSIADEMALTICRTTYSGVLRDNMDFSTAFADADGKLVAQGLTLPGHLGSIPTALDVVVERFGDDTHPGDVFILNDPFDGGMHLPDIFIFQPIFAGGERIAYLTTGHGELNDPLVQDSLAPNYAPLESWMPSDAPPGPELPPLTVLRRMLELLNYRVLDLGARDGLGDRIPYDAAIVMVLGPQRPFFDSEANALRAYLDRGGALLVALEAGSEFRIDEFRDRLGIDHDPVTVVDDQSHMRETGSVADRRLIVTSRYSAHPAVTTISRRGVGGGVLFLGAEALTPAEDVPGLRHSQLVRSTPWSFADRNGNFRFDEEAESRESLGLAIAVEAEAAEEAPDGAETPTETPVETPEVPGMRALVFGDAEIFSDRVLASLQLNAVMIADGIRWLGKEEAFAGEVVSEADVPIIHTRAEDVAWFYAIIFGAPMLVVAGGVLALYGRRAKPGASA